MSRSQSIGSGVPWRGFGSSLRHGPLCITEASIPFPRTLNSQQWQSLLIPIPNTHTPHLQPNLQPHPQPHPQASQIRKFLSNLEAHFGASRNQSLKFPETCSSPQCFLDKHKRACSSWEKSATLLPLWSLGLLADSSPLCGGQAEHCPTSALLPGR
jgi:hypothetical protein